MGRTLGKTVIAIGALFAAASCGNPAPEAAKSAVPAPTTAMTSAGPWQGVVKGVDVSTATDGGTVIKISPSVQGYQAWSKVPTSGQLNLTLNYGVTMKGGPGYLGVLKGDQTAWVQQSELPADKFDQNRITVPLPAGQTAVWLVFSTSPKTSKGAEFDVQKVEYILH